MTGGSKFIQLAAARTTEWTPGAPRSYVVDMIRRRDDRKPLSNRRDPHWLTVSDMQGRVLDSTPLESGTDLYAVLARAMDRLAAQGWTIEDDGRFGSFFCNR